MKVDSSFSLIFPSVVTIPDSEQIIHLFEDDKIDMVRAIAAALLSKDHLEMLDSEQEKILKDLERHEDSLLEGMQLRKFRNTTPFKMVMKNETGRPVEYTIKCLFPLAFQELRNIFISASDENSFAKSLSRCGEWNAQGGKSKAFFAKSLDDQLIVKEISEEEFNSFIKFAPKYFSYVARSLDGENRSSLGKIFGLYEICNMKVLVMQNVFAGRDIVRSYDLKGSNYSRRNAAESSVLLDENLVSTPLFVDEISKKQLEEILQRDTLFLAANQLIYYSLLVGIDQGNRELIVGTVDYIQDYNFRKRIEFLLKSVRSCWNCVGGSSFKHPTIIPPRRYGKRFKNSICGYFSIKGGSTNLS